MAVDGAFEDLPADPDLLVTSADGFKTGEGLLLVRSGERVSLVVADLVLDVPNGPGLRGLAFRLLGLTGDGPRLPTLVKWRVVGDRAALRAHLERLAATPGLARIVTSHGAIVEARPAEVLREIAARV